MHEPGLSRRIQEFVRDSRRSPFYPHDAFPREYFEEGLAGRSGTIAFCCRAVEMCDEFWVFGISEEVIVQLGHALRCAKPVSLLYGHKQFDGDWRKHRHLLKPLLEVLDDLNLPCYSELRDEIESDLRDLR